MKRWKRYQKYDGRSSHCASLTPMQHPMLIFVVLILLRTLNQFRTNEFRTNMDFNADIANQPQTGELNFLRYVFFYYFLSIVNCQCVLIFSDITNIPKSTMDLKSKAPIEIIKQAYQEPFSEYEFISPEEVSSEEFKTKYKCVLMIDNRVVPVKSDFIKALAKKMNKTAKAAQLQVKRSFSKSSGNNENNDGSALLNHWEPEVIIEENSGVVDANNFGDSEEACVVETFCESFELGAGQIFDVQTSQRIHRGKTRDVQRVKSGWPQKLSVFLFEKTSFNCKFDFQNIWISKDETVKTFGCCECGARVETCETSHIHPCIR